MSSLDGVQLKCSFEDVKELLATDVMQLLETPNYVEYLIVSHTAFAFIELGDEVFQIIAGRPDAIDLLFEFKPIRLHICLPTFVCVC